VRRYFYDIHVTTNAPIAGEALQRIGRLFDVERAAMGLPPGERRRIRQSAARPLIDDLATFLDADLQQLRPDIRCKSLIIQESRVKLR
jgi:hypothetical protein